jgi:hypothetical protein
MSDEQDHRRFFIDLFYAVIITVGLERFYYDFLLKESSHLQSVIFREVFSLHIVNVYAIFNTFLFISAFVWIVTHWVVFHELIKKNPYRNWSKFFVDVILFFVMFLVINTSYMAYSNEIFPWFIITLISWHVIVCFWHLTEKSNRPIWEDLKTHIIRAVLYITIYCSYLNYKYFPILIDSEFNRNVIVFCAGVTIIILNLKRLTHFLGENKKVPMELSISKASREKSGFVKVEGNIIKFVPDDKMIKSVTLNCSVCGCNTKIGFSRPIYIAIQR